MQEPLRHASVSPLFVRCRRWSLEGSLVHPFEVGTGCRARLLGGAGGVVRWTFVTAARFEQYTLNQDSGREAAPHEAEANSATGVCACDSTSCGASTRLNDTSATPSVTCWRGVSTAFWDDWRNKTSRIQVVSRLLEVVSVHHLNTSMSKNFF